jgi:hypothetical protein
MAVPDSAAAWRQANGSAARALRPSGTAAWRRERSGLEAGGTGAAAWLEGLDLEVPRRGHPPTLVAAGRKPSARGADRQRLEKQANVAWRSSFMETVLGAAVRRHRGVGGEGKGRRPGALVGRWRGSAGRGVGCGGEWGRKERGQRRREVRRATGAGAWGCRVGCRRRESGGGGYMTSQDDVACCGLREVP